MELTGPSAAEGRATSLPRTRVRLQDVATSAGVSLSQASAAISGRSGVSAATRARVLHIARQLGYQPNDHAQALARATRSRFVSIVLIGVSEIDSEPPHYLGAMLNGILLRTAAVGLDVRVSSLESTDRTIEEQLRTLCARDVADGYVILTYIDVNAASIAPLKDAGAPFVLINRCLPGDGTLVSTADFAGGARLAANHLIGFGHTNLGIICPQPDGMVVTEYLEGWHEAISNSPGIKNHTYRIPNEDPAVVDSLANELASGLSLGTAPTGVACLHELQAHQLLRALTDRAVAVPGDISLVTFDNAVAPYTIPALTSVDLKLHLVGITAVDLIASTLFDQTGTRAAVARIPAELLVRESSGPAGSQLVPRHATL